MWVGGAGTATEPTPSGQLRARPWEGPTRQVEVARSGPHPGPSDAAYTHRTPGRDKTLRSQSDKTYTKAVPVYDASIAYIHT